MLKQLKRIGVPLAMATQHPDSASRYIDANGEVDEAVRDLLPFEMGGFGCDEKMIDYEGKLTPYHQMRWISEQLSRLGLVAGEDYVLTPRVPNPRLEQIDRHLFTIIASLITNAYVESSVKYVIVPMIESSDELMRLYRRIVILSKMIQEELNVVMRQDIQVIPLIEDFSVMINVDNVLRRFVVSIKRELEVDRFRVMMGKSDTAMIYGHVTSIIGIKIALSRLWRLGEEADVKIYPIIGVGKLPFRGNLSQETVREFADTYRWFYTVTIQSGIRFDVGPHAVSKIITELLDNVGRKPRVYDSDEERLLVDLCRIMTREYLKFIIRIFDKILMLNNFIPKRRDRLEVAVYSRTLTGGAMFTQDPELINMIEDRNPVLPRAINFVAAMYTMGIPPVIVGLGRGLREVKRTYGEHAFELLIREIQPIIAKDLEFDLPLLDLEVSRRYMGERPFKLLYDDYEELTNMFSVKMVSGPMVERHRHLIRLFSKSVGREECTKYLLEAGVVRGSLG